jgi:hypothetical protein
MTRKLAGFILGMAVCVGPVAAQQPAPPPPTATIPTATPLNGQTADKTALDTSECKNGATQATGYVPGSPPPVVAQPSVGGERIAGAATGAAAGAVVGGIQNNNHPYAPDAVRDEHRRDQAATGAAVGMMAGGAKHRQNRRAARNAQETAVQQQSAAEASWQNSYKACLTQRGYSVP